MTVEKRQAVAIVEGLRRAQASGEPVVELFGAEARDFAYVRSTETHPEVLGSFRIQGDLTFSAVIACNPKGVFSLLIYEGRDSICVLTDVSGDGLVWRYSPSKQSGDNAARKKAFFDAAGAESLTIPLPEPNLAAFTEGVKHAIALRHLADDAGGEGDDADDGDPTLPARPAQPRYWKVSPGEHGEIWDECRDGGYIAMGWDKLGDLTGVDHEEFKRRAAAVDASDQVWKFRNFEVGDRIVANRGTTRVLGIGTVTGPYYRVDGVRRGHRIPVRWDDTQARVVEMKGWRKTLIRLNQETFRELEAAPLVSSEGATPAPVVESEAVPEGGIDFDGILSQLDSKSLSFSAEVVASYLLALQAKRFVLLTGISGTGKTQLALEVARVFGPTSTPVASVETAAVEMTAKPYQLKYSRFIIPSELAQEFDALANPEVRRIELKVPGLAPAAMTVGRNAQGGNLLQLLLSGEVGAWFKRTMSVGTRYLLSRRAKGDHEWLELELPSVDAPPKPMHDGAPTYEMVAVRPDWTDARALLGFYNPLTNAYLPTPTLQLLLRAAAEVNAATEASPPRPYFLIFDEMNLARVEHYFADFLSAMESGEAIHLHDDAQVEEVQEIPRRLTIPKNLFVVGTVNVDETTYMFSPKVLDRAFVLEFNDVDLRRLGGMGDDDTPTALALVNLASGLKLRGPTTDGEWTRFEQVLGGAAGTLLHALHAALASDHRHFGYRVAREIARFVDLAVEQTDGGDAAVAAAFDVAVLAKVLPKLHGSQAELEPTLQSLLSVAIGGKAETAVFSASGDIVAGAAVPLPRTARKLWRMLRRLRARGFVSFIE